MPDRLLSPEEIAERCALSRRAIYRAIERGELRASRLCGRLRIASEDVDEWIASSAVKPDEPAHETDSVTARRPGRLRAALDEEHAA